MANYKIVNGELRHCDDELYHKKFKYTYKTQKNGKWVYYYNGDEKNAKTGRALVGKEERKFIRTDKQGYKRQTALNEANAKETNKAKAMDSLYKKTNSKSGKIQSKVNVAIGKVRGGVENASKEVGYAKAKTRMKVKANKIKFDRDPKGYVKDLLNKGADKAQKSVNDFKKESSEAIDKAKKFVNKKLKKKKR